MPRREDRRLVRGEGTYLDDLAPEGCAHVAFVRSPVAHGRIRSIDRAGALEVRGVIAVITADDLTGAVQPLPLRATPLPEGFAVENVPMPVLAGGEVRFAGEPVAAVLAESRAAAEDGADRVTVEIDPLPAVASISAALEGAARVHDAIADNILFRWDTAGGDTEAAFSRAAHVIRGNFRIPRLQAAPMETRGCIASFDSGADRLTLWCSSQDPHRPRRQLAQVLGRDLQTIRVVVPDVGGAFGSKGGLAPEHAVAAFLAIGQRRPVKWVETRSENFLSAYQGRGMEADCELAVDGNGRMLGLRAELRGDAGAYLLGHTAVVAATAVGLLTGAYAIPAVDVRVLGVATNKVPTGPYRGAGRPEASFFIERLADLAARRLGLDPVELRRRNLVDAARMPYRTPLGADYDSGDYPGLMDRALELIDYRRERGLQEQARREGRLRGVGLAVVVESSGNSAWETAAATLQPDGTVLLLPGSSDHGQGHATTFAQIAADRMGIPPDRVEVRRGDSAEVPLGVGTFASRSVTVGGSAVLLALDELRQRCRTWGAYLLDVPEEQLAWEGEQLVGPDPAARVTLGDIAAGAFERGPVPDMPELRGDGHFTLPGLAYGSGACAATVEVDRETGVVRVERVVAVDDAGTVINPLLAEGQVIGSSVQGLAASLFEEVVHDEDGQPLTESFLNYLVPTLADITSTFVTEFRPTRSPLSPLGTKGVAESGCIAVPAAIANAVIDALSPTGPDHLDPPYSPERVWRQLQGA